MGQQDISKILEKNGGWMTIRQIAEELGQTPGLICTTLLKMKFWVLKKEEFMDNSYRKIMMFKLK